MSDVGIEGCEEGLEGVGERGGRELVMIGVSYAR